MPKPLNFTLRVASNEAGQIKLDMDLSPPFSHDLSQNTKTQPFDPKGLQKVLEFVSGDVIRKVVEHIHKQAVLDAVSKDPKMKKLWKQRRDLLTALNAVKDDISEKSKITKDHTLKLNKLEEGLQSDAFQELEAFENNFVDKIIGNSNAKFGSFKSPIKKDVIVTNIHFEKMSPGTLTYSVQTAANGDVPPPKIKGSGAAS